ncbi:zinc transporter ZIP4 isoform X2 [Lampris incognitus]|nr:zinc transporter ZIP4 isoform X2 [Lampris incognitus]XP_056154271.1 zinc transporter ZIP4 isoform X2 [Lampris incognitus]
MVSSTRPLLLLAILGLFGSGSGRSALEECYSDVVSAVSSGQDFLTTESVRSLLNILQKRVQCSEVSCEKCNLAENVHQLIGNHSGHEERGREGDVIVTLSQFTNLATGCVFYLSSPALACTAVTEGRWREEVEHFLHRVTHHEDHEDHQEKGGSDHDHADTNGRLHNRDHSPDHDHGHPHEYTDGHTHAHEEGHHHEHIDLHGLQALLQELENHYKPLDHESCLSASDIMREVNASSSSEAGTDQKAEVGVVFGRVLYHTLRGHCLVSRALPKDSFFLDYIIQRIGSENFTVSDLEVLMRSLNLGRDGHGHEDDGHHHGHKDDHVVHDHSGRKLRKRSRHEHQEGQGRNKTWDKHCFSAEELALIHGMVRNKSVMDRSDAARLSPALLQQILSGACTEADQPLKPDDLTEVERYIYATIANTVICLMSMFGIVVLLCTSCSNVFQLSIQFCVSLAVGTLTGDALLHLLPMFLGLHVHSDSSSRHGHHDHDHEEENQDYIYKMMVVLAGIYYFYLMESIFALVTCKKVHHHHPHHHGEESEPHHCDHGNVLEMYQQERRQKDKQQSISQVDLVECENKKSFPLLKERTREQRLLPYMITIGDGIHNFADGLAIGAAFSLSWKSGLATSLAVLCHELPHELGDFAVLLHSGVSVRKALLLNVSSAMTSFIGLYIALSVATDLATKQWIAAITAGLFLYVGLADMLPTMIHIKSNRPWLMFLLQNVGLLAGWAILLTLSLYEDQIGI